MITSAATAVASAILMLTAAVATAQPASELSDRRFGSWGYDAAGSRSSTAPGVDFFDYANGVYLDHVQIPADEPEFGVLDDLDQLSRLRVRAILEDAAKTTPARPRSVQEKLGAFYRAYMDQARVDRLGVAPLDADLANIWAESTKSAVAAAMGASANCLQDSLIHFGIAPDRKDPGRYAFYIGQGGLGLPDRDYYVEPRFAAKLVAYGPYVERLLALAGWSDPQASAAAVVQLELRLAAVHWRRAERRDPLRAYNPTTLSELAELAPGLDWHAFLNAAQAEAAPKLVLAEKSAVIETARIVSGTPLTTLKAWQAFHLIDAAAPYLSQPFVQAHFEFHEKLLTGQPEIAPRWKQAFETIDRAMQEGVGHAYVDRWFSKDSKAAMADLVGNVKAALRARLQSLDWMTAQTKAEALRKLDAYTFKIGYPDVWRDYSGLVIRSDDLYGDVVRSRAFDYARDVQRLPGPVVRTDWMMGPQAVNAYYSGSLNEVVLTAAIAQPPMFDPHGDMAVNYGAIGAFIGHEMTHGFDDQGRKFDAQGRLRDWWTQDDAAGFEVRAERLGKLYDSYEVLPGKHIQGKLTMGENIADQGGLAMALDAYHLSLHGHPAPAIAGFTGDQRVFLGWAQMWREKRRDDAAEQALSVDPHSPGKYRVNGVVRNLDAWYVTFDVRAGDPLYLPPDERARIW